MTYQVLARKWRPKSFSTLVGQEHVVKALSNALESQRLHHAYLLTGTRGVGKTTIARILAKSLNCESGITASPCGRCDACLQIDAGRFVDLLEIDAASNTGIDNIREVLDNAQYSPTQGRFKVYIIDEVHMLSKSAFNAMLKTLEEPPSHVKFILATTDPQKVPVTVLSRCLQFSLRQMLPPQIAKHLQQVLDAEAIPYEIEALTLLGHAAAGSMRDALSLLDQAIAYGSGKVEEAGIRTMLGAVDQSYLYDLLEQLANQNGAGLMAAAEQLAVRGIASDAILQELSSLLHLLALMQTVPTAITQDHPQYSALNALAPRFSIEQVQLLYQITLHGRRDLALAPDEFAGLSMTLLRMLAFAPTRRLASAEAPVAPVSHQESPTKPTASAIAATPVIQAAEPAKPSVAKTMPSTAASTKKAIGAELLQEMQAPPPWESMPANEAAPRPDDAPNDTHSDENQRGFDGNWPKLLKQIRLGGQAGMLAQHAELVAFTGLHFELAVADTHRVVAGPEYREKLEQSLGQHFGERATIKINVGGATESTPAALQQRERAARLAEAEVALNADPLVQALISEFDATILPESIQPRTEPI
ncbi:DNA polymerase III subunit gamma/tau [Chitinimonas sp. BJB300]|uniref:DNA polymerase III subunit gamma/tau n=1 Tax=Chitinimonas sp. BJB300 TaxID=1559339 RepID=UPI000C115D15|nr:DNA polymerase III subunit gamma/tau [Chitinimonas sp. BJB300]PHV12620.1 DNA polymerase III subunit gamma/tau [Chitinimonas sp. BJB300]TSJ89937.1 DNA polymerase III subunit gamma/tau [Chitinimonas sp. BJB300]